MMAFDAWQADSNSITVSGVGDGEAVISFTGQTFRVTDAGTSRYGSAVGSYLPSFEVELVSADSDSAVAVGLVSQKSPLASSMPGWQVGDIGLHLDDGKLYMGSITGREFCVEERFTKGDKLLCGIEFLDSSKKSAGGAIGVYFSKNDERIGWTVIMEPPQSGLFPAVGVLGQGTAVKVRVHAMTTSGDARFAPATSGATAGMSNRSGGIPRSGGPDAAASQSVVTVVNHPVASGGPPARTHGLLSLSSVRGPGDPIKWGHHNNVLLGKDGAVTYSGLGVSMKDVGLAQALKPLLLNRSFFEVSITDCGEHGLVSVGVTSIDHKLTLLPGWQPDSLGYHGDDGYLFTGAAESGKPFGPKASKGDRIGCGLRWSMSQTAKTDEDCLVEVYFTHNGSFIGSLVVQQPQNGFYATIGLLSASEVISVYYCDPPANIALSTVEKVEKPSGKDIRIGGNVLSTNVMKVQDALAGGHHLVKGHVLEDVMVSSSASGLNSLSALPDMSKPFAEEHTPLVVCNCSELLTCTPKQFGAQQITYADRSKGMFRPACAVMCNSLTEKWPFFEVTLDSAGLSEEVCVGVTVKDCPLEEHPHRAKPTDSIAFSWSDGLLWHQGESTLISPRCTKGDRIGCGIDFAHTSAEVTCIVFTRNGTPLTPVYTSIAREECHGFVCLASCCQVITVNFRHALPSPDIKDVNLQISRICNVEQSGDQLSHISHNVGFVQFRTLLCTQTPYFEVCVQSAGMRNRITIGVALGEHPFEVPPGSAKGSAGFSPGRVLDWPLDAPTTTAVSVDPRGFRRHDYLGVGITGALLSRFLKDPQALHPVMPGRKVTIFFTRNRRLVHALEWFLSLETNIYPVISLHSFGVAMRIVQQPVWPSEWKLSNDWVASSNLRSLEDRIAYTGQGERDNDVGLAVARQCLSPSEPYFEIEIEEPGKGCYIGIGIGLKCYPTTTMVGWFPGAVGYHADDGFLFSGDGKGNSFGPVCEAGDFMGCGVRFGQVTNNGLAPPLKVFFTRNHQIIGETSLPSASSQQGSVRLADMLYPLVSLHSEGAIVRPCLNLTWPPVVPGIGMGWARSCYVHYHIEDDVYHYTEALAQGLRDVGSIQAAEPVSPECNYFEATIINSGTKGRISVGLVSSGYQFGIQPGWGPESIAYHSDDGALFHSRGRGEKFAARAVQGDVIGCGVVFPSATQTYPMVQQRQSHLRKSLPAMASCKPATPSITVFFTRNGVSVGECRLPLPPGGFFPSIGMHSPGEKVRVRLNCAFPSKCTLGAAWASSVRLALVNDKEKIIEYTGRCGSHNDLGVAVAKQSLTSHQSFFAAKVVSLSPTGTDIVIGLVDSSFPRDGSHVPGSMPLSVGLHISSGGLFQHQKPTQLVAPACKADDVIGCGIDFGLSTTSSKPHYTYVCFTANSHTVARVRLQCHPSQLFPAVSMHSKGQICIFLDNAPVLARPRQVPVGWARSEHVQVLGNLVRRVPTSISSGGAVGLAQAIMPSSSYHDDHMQYFEVSVVELGRGETISVGLATLDAPATAVFGTSRGSVALSLGRRCVFCSCPVPTKHIFRVLSANDRVGCGILWLDSDKLPSGSAIVVFTQNKQELVRLLFRIPEGIHASELLPTVTLGDSNAEVLMDMEANWQLTDTQWMQLMGAKISDNGLTISRRSDCETCLAQSRKPLTVEQPYFEVTVNGPMDSAVIGLTHATFLLNKQLGWADGSSVAMSLGKCVVLSSGETVSYTPLFVNGDRVGCGVDFSESSLTHGIYYASVYFTHNGRIVSQHILSCVYLDVQLYPSLEIAAGDVSVAVVSDARPPTRAMALISIGWMHVSRLVMSGHGHALLYAGRGESDSDVGLAMAASHLTPEKNFFQMQLCSTGHKGWMAIGLANAEYQQDCFPGWRSFSVAYHADDGGIFHSSGRTDRYGPPCRQGDTMGCGIDFSTVSASEMDVFFTKNGLEIGRVTVLVPPGGLYPVIGLLTEGERVFVEFSQWHSQNSTQLNITQ